MTTQYLVGDVRERMRELADGSVSLVACSPPFIALRSYLPADHPDKALEIGSEPDPATFIDVLLQLTAEWGRVLAPWGSIAIELGDTYAGSGGAGGDYNAGGMRDGAPAFTGSAAKGRLATYGDDRGNPAGMRDTTFQGGNTRTGGGAGWPRPKCLALVPQAYALSLAYGRNVLTGEESPAGQWLVRNEIVWHRPNPAVGALGDKFRPSTSYIVVATRSAKRWFDLTAVRNGHARDYTNEKPGGLTEFNRTAHNGLGSHQRTAVADPAGAPPLDCWFDEHDVWTLTTQPSKLAHYAMWPAKLAERIVLSMCPAEVCAKCGEPRRRIEGKAEYVGQNGEQVEHKVWQSDMAEHGAHSAKTDGGVTRTAPTLGWSDCGCACLCWACAGGLGECVGRWKPGTVLDPFAGTGTTLAVAELCGRDAIGIDIDSRNKELYGARRVEVESSLARGRERAEKEAAAKARPKRRATRETVRVGGAGEMEIGKLIAGVLLASENMEETFDGGLTSPDGVAMTGREIVEQFRDAALGIVESLLQP